MNKINVAATTCKNKECNLIDTIPILKRCAICDSPNDFLVIAKSVAVRLTRHLEQYAEENGSTPDAFNNFIDNITKMVKDYEDAK